MSRAEFPTKVKVAAWRRCGGNCEGCGAKLYPGRFDYDHVIPDGLTGEPTVENCKVLCRACHSVKTKRDVADIARAKRREAAHIGARARTSRPIPGSKSSPFRKRLNGQVERRT